MSTGQFIATPFDAECLGPSRTKALRKQIIHHVLTPPAQGDPDGMPLVTAGAAAIALRVERKSRHDTFRTELAEFGVHPGP